MLSLLVQAHASHLTQHIQPDNMDEGQHSRGSGIDNKGLWLKRDPDWGLQEAVKSEKNQPPRGSKWWGESLTRWYDGDEIERQRQMWDKRTGKDIPIISWQLENAMKNWKKDRDTHLS